MKTSTSEKKAADKALRQLREKLAKMGVKLSRPVYLKIPAPSGSRPPWM